MLEKFILGSIIVHVFAGGLALLSGLGAILFRKKVKIHKPFGRIYFWSMTVIFITALYVSVYRQNYFLLFIGIFTFHASLTAFRSLKLKKLHLGQKPQLIDWTIETLNIAANTGLLVLAIYFFMDRSFQWGIICLAFGSIGLRGSSSNIKRLRGKVQGSNYWLRAHIGGMLASYIGAITAFTVNNNRWLGLPNVVAWLGPTVILVPFIFSEIARVNKTSKA